MIIFLILYLNPNRKSEKFEQVLGPVFDPNVQYTLTLGNWGQPQPKFCFETKPERNAMDVGNNFKACNACNLACSTKEASDRCQSCLNYL